MKAISQRITILYNELENYAFIITTTSPRGQWVNSPSLYDERIFTESDKHQFQKLNTFIQYDHLDIDERHSTINFLQMNTPHKPKILYMIWTYM